MKKGYAIAKPGARVHDDPGATVPEPQSGAGHRGRVDVRTAPAQQ
jgi:hypothetical protein